MRNLIIILFFTSALALEIPDFEIRIHGQRPNFSDDFVPIWTKGTSGSLELGITISPGINLGGLLSYLEFGFNRNHTPLVDLSYTKAEANYVKIAGILKTDLLHSLPFTEKVSPYILTGIGQMKQYSHVEGWSWGQAFDSTIRRWLHYFILGGGVDLFQSRRLSLFADYRYEHEYSGHEASASPHFSLLVTGDSD
jgi:hypothetical protein